MESQRISIFSNTKSDRDFRATTGLSKEEFNRLSDKFSCYYTPTVLSGFPNGFGNNSIFQNPKEALFFLLYHYKVATTYDVFIVKRLKALLPIEKKFINEFESFEKLRHMDYYIFVKLLNEIEFENKDLYDKLKLDVLRSVFVLMYKSWKKRPYKEVE